MPVDPTIARGIQPIDVSNTLAQIAMLRQRDQALADDRAQTAALQQQIQAKQQAAAEHEQALVEAISKNDWATVARLDPEAAREIRAQQEAEYRQANPEPPTLYKTAEGFLPGDQAIGKMPYQEPQQAPTYAPTEKQRDFQFYSNLSPEQRAQYDRLYGKPTDGGVANPLDLNPRQKSGYSTQQDSLLNYAANLTGLGREEIDRIYATQGPSGVGRVMRDKGKRTLQGGVARLVQELPFGQAIVDATNSDIVAPMTAGGAGIAQQQNPTGPITNADVMVGRLQMPGPQYPLEVQASMTEQQLAQSAKAIGQPQAAAPAPNKTVVRTGTHNGRKVVQYSDGTIEYQ